MPIQFQCPACGHAMQLPDTAAGKQGKCPKCQTAVTVPGGAVPALSEHDEEFWSEVADKDDSLPQEEEPTHEYVPQTDGQVLKMYLRKGEEDKEIKRIGLPWENPLEGGVLERYWDTSIAVMNHPGTAFAEMRLSGGIKKAVWYLVLGTVFGMLFFALYATIASAINAYTTLEAGSAVIEEELSESGEVEAEQAEAVVTTAIVIGIVIAHIILFCVAFFGGIVVSLIHSVLQALLLHGGLSIAGVQDKDFERTFRVTAFVNGSIMLCNIVPGLGLGFMLFLWFVAMVQGLIAVYGVTQNKAALALMVVFVPLLLPIVGLVVLAMIGAYSSMMG